MRCFIERDGERAVRIGRRFEEIRPLAGEVAHRQLAGVPMADQRADVAVHPQNRSRELGARLPQIEVPRARVARRRLFFLDAAHLPVASDRRRLDIPHHHRHEPAHGDVLAARPAVVLVGPFEIVSAQRQLERRVEEVVFELQRAVGKRARRRSDLAIAFEEEPGRLVAVGGDLESEWDFDRRGVGPSAAHDDRFPEAVDLRRGVGARRQRKRGGNEDDGRDKNASEAPSEAVAHIESSQKAGRRAILPPISAVSLA